MADVNPNQDLRFKEIMKRMIPSGYLFSFIYLSVEISGDGLDNKDFKELLSIGNDLSPAVTFAMLTIVVYVVGVLINYLASLAERSSYKIGLLKRPSQRILNDDTKDYKVEGIEKIREEFKSILFNGIVCEQQAKQIVNTIKGRINRKDNMVEEMYHQSVLARNLLATQFLGCAIIAFFDIKIIGFGYFFISIALIGFFFKEWRRKNFVYMRNIFQEDLRKENNKNKNKDNNDTACERK